MLTRPSPYPEELDRGYLGRVMRTNGIATEKNAVTLMSTWAGVADKSRCEVSCLELLSKVADKDLPTFVKQHSTLPFRRAITSYQPNLSHGSEESRSMLWTTGMRLARSGAYFCAECVHEDQGFHGQSYWRREHQIPGMLWCSKHATPLKYTEDESAFLLPPAMQLQNCQSIDEAWVNELFNNKAIQRYSEICSTLLDTRFPARIRHVSVILKKQAVKLGFQIYGGEVKSPLFSDALIETFGRKWLSMVLPELADKPARVFLYKVDEVLFAKNCVSSTIAYILAFAALYDSADAALNAMQSRPKVTIAKPRHSSIKLTRDELIDAYIQGRGSHSKAASVLNDSKWSISTKLKALGLPNLVQKSKQNRLMAVFAFYVEKQSLQASAAKGNISLAAMEKLIRNANCDLTRALQAIQRPVGRGAGVRRARQLTPAEASLATGPAATKFSTNISREQILAQ